MRKASERLRRRRLFATRSAVHGDYANVVVASVGHADFTPSSGVTTPAQTRHIFGTCSHRSYRVQIVGDTSLLSQRQDQSYDGPTAPPTLPAI